MIARDYRLDSGFRFSDGIDKVVAPWSLRQWVGCPQGDGPGSSGRHRVRQNHAVHLARTFTAYAAAAVLCCASCTSGSGGSTGSAPVRTTPSSPSPATQSVTSRAETATSVPPVATTSAAPRRDPRVPADVPLTGVNTRPGEKPPVMPAVATQDNAKGAQAFGAFFIRTLDWGWATMSSAYMRHYMDPSCVDCSVFARVMDRATRLHHRYAGGRISILGVEMAGRPSVAAADGTALVHFNLSTLREFDGRRRVVYTNPGYRHATFQVSVLWEINHWAVYDLGSKA